MIALVRNWQLALGAIFVVGLIAHYEGIPLVYDGKIDRIAEERLASERLAAREEQRRIAKEYADVSRRLARELADARDERNELLRELDDAARDDPDAGRPVFGPDSLRRLDSIR